MYTFTDRQGNSWDVTLTMLSARRVDNSDFTALTKQSISFLKPEREVFMEILQNTPLCFGIIWAIVKPQADAKDLTEEQFLDALDGGAVQSGKEAFWESVANFFPEQRTALRHWILAVKKTGQRMTKEVENLIPRIDGILDKMIDDGMVEVKQELENIGQRSLKSAG